MDNRHHLFYYLVLFLISPVLSIVAAMANFGQKNARLTLVLFVAAFGYTIILRPGADSYSHAMNFANRYSSMSFAEFQEIMLSIITLGGGKTLGVGADELYLPIISYTLSQFTNSMSILFLFVGLIYGYFFIRGISLVYSDMQRNWNIVLLILFVFFLSWKNLDGVNSIRNWTGAWVFFNGAYLYLKTRNINYILLVLLAPLFHAGYLVIILPFFAYLVIGDRKYLLFGILVASYLLSTSMQFIEPYLTATELGETKLDAYSPREDGFEGEDNRNIHIRYYRDVSDWIIQGLFIYSILFMGYFKGKDQDLLRTGLAGVGILMLSMANFAGIIPVLAERVFVNFGLYALAYLVLHYSYLQPPSGIHKNIVYIAIPGILFFLFVQYSRIGDYMDFRVLVSPLIYPFLGDDPVSMKEFIRSLIF